MNSLKTSRIEHPIFHILFAVISLLVSLVLINYTFVYAQPAPQIKISPDSGGPEITTIAVSGMNLPPATPYSIDFGGAKVTTDDDVVDSEGKFIKIIPISPDLKPGDYEIIVTVGETVKKGSYTLQPAGVPAADNTTTKSEQTENTTAKEEQASKSYLSHIGDSVDIGLIGLFLGVILAGVLLLFTPVLAWLQFTKRGDLDYRYSEAQRSLDQYKREYSKSIEERDKAKRELSRFQSNTWKLPQLKSDYNKVRQEVRRIVPQTKMGIIEGIDNSLPVDEYSAYYERTNALAAVAHYVTKEAETAKKLREECLRLVEVMKQEEPALYDTLQKVITSTNVDGLAAVKPLLEQIGQEIESREVSASLQDELTTLEKSIENIRDYSFRLVPSKLIKFSRDLIKTPGSEKENAIREKTVRELMKLVDEYLRL